MSEFNPILSGTRTPEGIKQRLEDARQQLIQAANVEDKNEDTQLKILARLESMEDNQIDIHNIIDSVWSELISIHDTIKLYTAGRELTGISKLEECKQREKEAERKEKHFYDTTTIGGVKCSEFQKGNVPNTHVLPAPKFINGIEQKCSLCENFDKGIKEGSMKPLTICILPDDYTVTGKYALELLKSQFPHLCDNLHTGTWTIIYKAISKSVVYYHLPAHKHEVIKQLNASRDYQEEAFIKNVIIYH
jgi:hypothetical protein